MVKEFESLEKPVKKETINLSDPESPFADPNSIKRVATKVEKSVTGFLVKLQKKQEDLQSADYSLDSEAEVLSLIGLFSLADSYRHHLSGQEVPQKLKEELDAAVHVLEETIFDKLLPSLPPLEGEPKLLEDNYHNLLTSLAMSSRPETGKKVVGYLIRDLELIAKGRITRDKDFDKVLRTLISLAGREEVISREKLKDIFIKVALDDGVSVQQSLHFFFLIESLFPVSSFRGPVALYAQFFLEKYNLPAEKVFDAWNHNSKIGSFKDKGKKESRTEGQAARSLASVIRRNLVTILMVEREKPGICKFLHENYGISNFGRFGHRVWIRQYEQHENQGPYGLVIAAEDDWNSSSYEEGTIETYDALYKDLLPSHILRIIEIKTVTQLARMRPRLRKRYSRPPDFVVWSGHSNKDAFFFGPSIKGKKGYKFLVSADDFHGRAKERVLPYLDMFSADTIMILDGCSQEDEESLSEVAAGAIGNIIIHPRGKTQVEDFGVTVDSNKKLSFNVKYRYDIEPLLVNGKK